MKKKNDEAKDTLRARLLRRAKKLSADIPAVMLALKRKDTPFSAKLCAGITIVYALSPIDLIPDFIPVIGYLDDLVILPSLIALTVKRIPVEILDECRREAEAMQNEKNAKRWYCALPFVIFWLFVAFIIIKLIFF